MRRYCSGCNGSRRFTLLETVDARIRCEHCGKSFAVEAILKRCPECRKHTPHAFHKDPKYHGDEPITFICLNCGKFEGTSKDKNMQEKGGKA